MGTLHLSLLHEKATADGSGRCSASPTIVIKTMEALPSLTLDPEGFRRGSCFSAAVGSSLFVKAPLLLN